MFSKHNSFYRGHWDTNISRYPFQGVPIIVFDNSQNSKTDLKTVGSLINEAFHFKSNYQDYDDHVIVAATKSDSGPKFSREILKEWFVQYYSKEKKFRIIYFFETSAKNSENVSEVFLNSIFFSVLEHSLEFEFEEGGDFYEGKKKNMNPPLFLFEYFNSKKSTLSEVDEYEYGVTLSLHGKFSERILLGREWRPTPAPKLKITANPPSTTKTTAGERKENEKEKEEHLPAGF